MIKIHAKVSCGICGREVEGFFENLINPQENNWLDNSGSLEDERDNLTYRDEQWVHWECKYGDK